MVAAILITASSITTDVMSAKSRHVRSNSQSAAISNECPAFQDDDNAGNQAGLNQLATLATNCNGDIDLNQGDGAATASTSRTTSHQAVPQVDIP